MTLLPKLMAPRLETLHPQAHSQGHDPLSDYSEGGHGALSSRKMKRQGHERSGLGSPCQVETVEVPGAALLGTLRPEGDLPG